MRSALECLFFFGFLGIANALILWPLFLLFHYTSWESFIIPKGRVLASLFINALLGTVLSNYLWLWSMLLTTPLLATIGLSLTIPLAMIADTILHHKSFTVLYIIGVLLVIVGFITVSFAPKKNEISDNSETKPLVAK